MAALKQVLNHIKTCDVLVAGGGTAGCFAAIKAAGHLSRQGSCGPQRVQSLCSRCHQYLLSG